MNSASASKFNIVIVDDDTDLAANLQDILRDEGYGVTVATKPETALSLCSVTRFDLAIVDIKLPGITGIDLVERIQRVSPGTEYLIITGYAALDTALEAIRQKKILAYQTKPLDIEALLNAVRQIRERHQAEDVMLAQQKKLRVLTAKLLLAEEQERRRIATEVHDRIGQTLALALMRLSTIVRASPPDKMAEMLDEICGLLRQLVVETRMLTFELSPPPLYDLGLEAALRELIEHVVAGHGIEISFADDMRSKPLTEDVRVLLYHASRELLVNALEHAQAKTISMAVRRRGDMIEITVADDGIGMDPNILSGSMKENGFGLLTIQERLNFVGGNMAIDSGAGRGTKTTITAPLQKADTPDQ